MSRPFARGSRAAAVLMSFALAMMLAGSAGAQPFGSWTVYSGPTHGYYRVPHNAALNPAGAFTFEAWVSVTDANGCSSIAGKNYLQAWWIGICGTALRSYIKGSGSAYTVGVIPSGWTHIAVTYDGSNRRHYINGELVGTHAESGPLTSSTDELRIGSDTAWQHTPAGSLNEIRLWNVARSLSQIRANINKPITTPQAGLIAVWPTGGSLEIINGYTGTAQGSGTFGFTFPVALTCGASTTTALCLQTRFSITARVRTGAPGSAETPAHVAFSGPNSGIFWFFSSDNWEVMVKAINACPLNTRYWIYSAATTDQFYRMEVFDIKAGVNKVYFNYPGPPAPAVTDSDAFATCP